MRANCGFVEKRTQHFSPTIRRDAFWRAKSFACNAKEGKIIIRRSIMRITYCQPLLQHAAWTKFVRGTKRQKIYRGSPNHMPPESHALHVFTPLFCEKRWPRSLHHMTAQIKWPESHAGADAQITCGRKWPESHTCGMPFWRDLHPKNRLWAKPSPKNHSDFW